MIELKRGYDSNCKEKFIIKTDEGPFKIYYGSDLCLYWSCSASDDMKDFYQFTITNENRHVYDIFAELYDSVVSKMPFKHFCTDEPQKYYSYNDNNLVKDNAIEWHSDDFSYDAASVLKIEKNSETDNFIVSFYKSKLSFDDIGAFSTNSVKIGTGESRYSPYNATFIDMYKKMCNYCEQRGHTFSNSKFGRRRVRTR